LIARDGANEVVCALHAGCAEHEILELLTTHVDAIVGDDLVHRLVPYASRLLTFDYRGFPWAGLSAGVAICAIDRPFGRSVLSAARLELEAQRDITGEGYGCFLEGLEELGEGNLDAAAMWWARAMPLLTGTVPWVLISAHVAWVAYAGGDVGGAIELGQQALWAAEHAGSARAEVIACTGLTMSYLASGQFESAQSHVRRGFGSIEQLAPENRYELPILILAEAVLHTLRGDRDAAEIDYLAAIDESVLRGNRWYEAICLAVRGEFTAVWVPARAAIDARTALDYLDSINERWWSRSARIAYATAHLHTGNLAAGRAACATLLGLDLNPLDRGRTLLVAAEIAAADGASEAVVLAEQASALLAGAGAHYLVGRACMLLSRVDRRRREFHHRRAVQCAGASADDPGWQILLRGPGVLGLQLLGETRLSVNGSPIRFETRAELECLAMLALAARGLTAEVIGDRLWPDDDQFKVNHRVDNLVSGLRRRLDPTARVSRDRSRICLDVLPGECDVRDLVTAAEQQFQNGTFDHVRGAAICNSLTLPLLDGLNVPWVGLEQHRLHEIAARLELKVNSLRPAVEEANLHKSRYNDGL